MNTLKNKRIEKGYTQERIARELNITTRHYQRIENGESIPNVFLALKISDILNSDIRLLFNIEKYSRIINRTK